MKYLTCVKVSCTGTHIVWHRENTVKTITKSFNIFTIKVLTKSRTTFNTMPISRSANGLYNNNGYVPI